MERTLGDGSASLAETGDPMEPASEWDLIDATLIDEFDARDGVYRVEYDSTQATASSAVITIISTITGTAPLELDPLYESVDADAVDALFPAERSAVSQLSFQYNECEVTLRADEVVAVVAE